LLCNTQEVFEAEILIQIKPELRELDGELAFRSLLADFFENIRIVCCDGRSFGGILYVFAQVAQNRVQPASFELLSCRECLLRVLSRHKPRDRAAGEAVTRDPFTQPGGL